MVTMCASQYPTVESNEALEKMGTELEQEMEAMGALLLSLGAGYVTVSKLTEQWKKVIERYVGAELASYEA